MDHYLVALGEHVVDIPSLIAKRLVEHVHEHCDPVQTRGRAGRSFVVDELVADHIAQCVHVVRREDLLEHSPGDRLVVIGGHDGSPSRRVGRPIRISGAARAPHAGLIRFARLLAERGALRTGLTPERAADIIVTLGSLATYNSLVVTYAWTDDQYEDWLADSLQHALLG